jgi:ABC-type transport system substrate-binding protein
MQFHMISGGPKPVAPFSHAAKAKQLLTEAGFPDGFKTTLSFDLSEATVREPTAILIQEALKKIGVDLTLEKVPGSNWFAQMASKTMPMVIAEFYGWLDYPDYFFYWTYEGKTIPCSTPPTTSIRTSTRSSRRRASLVTRPCTKRASGR